MQRDRIYISVKMALLISFITASSYIFIPLPLSVFSFQTVAINLVALMLNPCQSLVTVGIWIVMGAVGLPVFSAGAGLGKLFGVTGGFYWGFLIAAPLMSVLKGKNPSFKRYLAVTVLVGITVQHICAVLVLCLHNGFDIVSAFQSVSLPFIIGDILKCAVSALIGVRLNKTDILKG